VVCRGTPDGFTAWRGGERWVGSSSVAFVAHRPLGVGLASAGQARWQSHRAGARAADVSAEVDRMHQILNGPEAAQR